METLNKSWNSRRWPGPVQCLTASSFNDVCILQKKLVSLGASGLGLEKLKEDPGKL